MSTKYNRKARKAGLHFHGPYMSHCCRCVGVTISDWSCWKAKRGDGQGPAPFIFFTDTNSFHCMSTRPARNCKLILRLFLPNMLSHIFTNLLSTFLKRRNILQGAPIHRCLSFSFSALTMFVLNNHICSGNGLPALSPPEENDRRVRRARADAKGSNSPLARSLSLYLALPSFSSYDNLYPE